MDVRDVATRDTALLSLLLTLLLAADGGFIIIHLVHLVTPYLPSELYSIETDGGFAEWFQYTKEFWCVLLLAALWRQTGRSWPLGWFLLYLYFLADDSISIHEIGGDIARRHLGFSNALDLRAQDFGELLVTGLAGLGLFSIIAFLYRRSTKEERTIAHDLFLLALTLVAFGVGLDMFHSMIPSENARLAMGMVEDGGEMLTMSVTLWYLLTVVHRGGTAPEPSLVGRVRKLAGR